MRKIKFIITAALLSLFIVPGIAQKKALDHSVYDSWKSVGALSMSDDGEWALYMVREQEGDGYLELLNITTLEQKRIERAQKPNLTSDGKYVIATITAPYSEIKEARRDKKKQAPKDSLAIYNISTKELIKYPFLKALKIGKDSKEYFAFTSNAPADTTGGKKAPKKEKGEGEDLMLYHLPTSSIDTIKYVTNFNFTATGDTLFYTTGPNSKDSLAERGLYLYQPKIGKLETLYTFNSKQNVRLPTISKDNSKMVFYANLDTTKEGKEKVSILYYKSGFDQAKVVVDDNIKGLQEGWQISINRALVISKDGRRLFYGIGRIPPKKDSTIIDSEVAQLDIWHYQEPFIPTVQKTNVNRDLRKSFISVIELDSPNKELLQISTDQYHVVRLPDGGNARWGFCPTNYRYELESQWSANPKNDLYIVDLESGEATLLLEKVYISSVTASPEGNYLVWYNNENGNWYSYNFATKNMVQLNRGIKSSFTDKRDYPMMNFSYGDGGWMEGDEALFLYDKYDVWKVDPDGKKKAVNITEGVGKKRNLTFRMVRLDQTLLPPGTPGVRKTPIAPEETIYFSVFDNGTKENGYYYKEMGKRKAKLTKWVVEPTTFTYLTRGKENQDLFIYTKQDFVNSPNIWITKDNFKSQIQVTDINSQQSEYNWGTAELMSWKSKIGEKIDGILYKPENFDPTKKYPMLVYFYERTSQHLHYYRAPAPSASTINIPFFVSNEYLVFVPDIHYQVGHPGKSAMDCIVPGVEKLIKENSWVDADNIAIQGQSWGGYQVAYMITQPELFKWKAAGAGAPVSNMTSAYSGVRWGSGVLRQFQYEHTQSRIGKDLWSGFDLYIENSPLFFADKVETPLLMMHNDKDEAVPWEQGIEYFGALRRLNKPVWMLQYNGESHNLSKRVNRKDLSIRLEQFFNHYLKGAPMPVWMKSGVPVTHKGIEWGLELVE